MTRRKQFAFVALGGVAVLGIAALIVWRPWTQRLVTIVRGGKGPPTFVLLHGYGSSAEQWEPFTQTIAFPRSGRFVFPQGPETTVPPDGPIGGRAWWRLDLASHIAPGHSVPDLSATRPPGIKTAASMLGTLLRDLSWSPGGPLVLGGFSQGSMVASELVFSTDHRIAALVILSGTLVDEATWEQNFSRRRGLPVFLSHGRSDAILPFEVADRFRSKLQRAGLDVTWVPFNGGHEVTEEVVIALNAFLRRLGAGADAP